MFREFIKYILVMITIFAVSACGKNEEEVYEGTRETVRLIRSFQNETPEMQDYIDEIIKEANDLNYQDAMNKLALLSATHKTTKQQKIAIELMMKQLRYDMEEEIFKAQAQAQAGGESER